MRVIGNLRSYGGKRHIVATNSLLRVPDFNELTCHMLEIIHRHVTVHGGGGRCVRIAYDDFVCYLHSRMKIESSTSQYSKQPVHDNGHNDNINGLQNEVYQS